MSNSSAAPRNRADDVATIVQLNDDYIDAVRTSNVQRFREILGDDFLCTLADGTLLDRAAIPGAGGAGPPPRWASRRTTSTSGCWESTAIVHAATDASRYPDGRPGRGRYTDVWVRRDEPVGGSGGAVHAAIIRWTCC